nr:MAG TPA: hypothetical protein [Caudoviricetes sp.]
MMQNVVILLKFNIEIARIKGWLLPKQRMYKG